MTRKNILRPLKWISLALMIGLVALTIALIISVVFEGETPDSLGKYDALNWLHLLGVVMGSTVLLSVLLWVGYYAFYLWRTLLVKTENRVLIAISAIAEAALFFFFVPDIKNIDIHTIGVLPVVMAIYAILDFGAIFMPKHDFSDG